MHKAYIRSRVHGKKIEQLLFFFFLVW